MKMKNWKRALSMTLAVVMAGMCFAGCSGKKTSSKGGEKEIEIYVSNTGNGIKYVENMRDAFLKKHPEYTVKIVANTAAFPASYGLEDIDTTDLYISGAKVDTDKLEPLDDILEYTVEGESIKIGDKFSKNYLEQEVFPDGHYYNLTPGNGGANGFVYNQKIFDKAGIDVLPRTSNELAAVCDKLLEEGVTPLCSFKDGGYWVLLGEAWFLQYDGWDYYYNTFYKNTDENGVSPSKELFTRKDGRYQTLKACEKFITPEYLLPGSTSSDHITMQTKFMNGECAIMLNGSWLENEMKSVGPLDDFRMMKMPVISSITDKLDTVKTETGLRQLITAIDEVTAGTKSIDEFKKGDNYVVEGKDVSAHDWEYVNLARHTGGFGSTGSSLLIPKYSDAKEGAKEFMKFWYSDEGAAILAKTMNTTPVFATENTEIDESNRSPFMQSCMEINETQLQSGNQFIKNQHEIFMYGGAISYGEHIYPYLEYYSANNPNDRIGADEAWQRLEKYVDQNYENNWLANIKK